MKKNDLMIQKDIFRLVRLGYKKDYLIFISKVDINLVNSYGQNLLHESITNSQIEIGLDLIDRGINLNHQDKKGQTVLHYAALHNQYELANYIVQKGGDVNIQDDFGNSPLWTATFNARGSYGIVRSYIAARGKSNLKNNFGKSPLDFAKKINDNELIEILLKSNDLGGNGTQ